jgi:hypothetical protein
LNKITIKNNYPLPQIDDLFDNLNGSWYFSRIKLKSHYYQICVQKANVEKMAMKTKCSSYKLLVMSFGLCNAPSFHHVDEFDLSQEVRWVCDHLHKWHFGVFLVRKGACNTFGVYVAKVQR